MVLTSMKLLRLPNQKHLSRLDNNHPTLLQDVSHIHQIQSGLHAEDVEEHAEKIHVGLPPFKLPEVCDDAMVTELGEISEGEQIEPWQSDYEPYSVDYIRVDLEDGNELLASELLVHFVIQSPNSVHILRVDQGDQDYDSKHRVDAHESDECVKEH